MVEIRREIDPIVRHGVVIIFLAFVSAAFAFVPEIIKAFLPRMKGSLDLVENIDGVTVLSLVAIFGVYTVLIVAARLLRSLRNEVQHLFR